MSSKSNNRPQADTDALPVNYEQAVKELETIVTTMESGQLSLEASLEAFKRGNQLLEFCQKSLADIEQQVKILNERQQLNPFSADGE